MILDFGLTENTGKLSYRYLIMNRLIKSIIVATALLLSGCYVYPGGVRYGIDTRSHFHDRDYYNSGYIYRNRPGYRDFHSDQRRVYPENRRFFPDHRGGMREFPHNRNFGQRYQGGHYQGGFRPGRRR